jgi:hypothetical protein
VGGDYATPDLYPVYGSPFWAAMYAFKAHAGATIAQMLPEPYAALLTRIRLSVEAGIPRGWYSLQNAIPIRAKL